MGHGPSALSVRALIAGALVLSTGALAAGCSLKEGDADLVAGKQLFVEKCGSCHVLKRAGTKGTTAPNLDEAFQQAQREGFGESAIRGVVRKQIQFPARAAAVRPEAVMPANLVEGDEAADVSAYVAEVVARPGEDTGVLADAVEQAGGGKPVAAADGVLSIAADPGGQLAYVNGQATAPAGELSVESPNESGTPHNIVIDGKGEGEVVQNGGVSKFTASFTAGKFEFYCSVPGHKEAGMKGTLTVE
jgi:mono/diheme cytochrome c family protein